MKIIDWHIMNCGLNSEIDRGFILYGASGTGKKIALLLRDLGLSDSIVAVVDSDENKWGKSLLNYKILSPRAINSISVNAIIIITSIYLDEIYKYLQKSLQCTNEICSSFSVYHALHYDILNNKSSYIRDLLSENYKRKYLLWKNGIISRNILSQQERFFDIIRHIMEHSNNILLCGMQKTGNISLKVSFENNSNAAFTLHSLYYDKNTYYILKEIIESFSKTKIKIISGIRQPIERIISNKWQVINYPYLYNDNCITTLLNKSDEHIITDLIETEESKGIKFNCRDYFYADTVEWFKDYIEKPFGINIFTYPFDKERGYTIINKNNISIFLYRLDKLSELENEIGEFASDDTFKLKKSNIASEKRYAFAYREYLENVKINRNFFYNLTESKGMKNFYTDKECEIYKDKWKEKLI